MAEARYLTINDDVGIDADGNPEPAVEMGVTFNVPTMKGDEVVDIASRVTLKPIPGTRTFKVTDPAVFHAALQGGHVHETDPPAQKDLAKARHETQDAREHAGTHTDKPEA